MRILWMGTRFFSEMLIGYSDLQSLGRQEMVNFVVFSNSGMFDWKYKSKTLVAFIRLSANFVQQ